MTVEFPTLLVCQRCKQRMDYHRGPKRRRCTVCRRLICRECNANGVGELVWCSKGDDCKEPA